MADTVGFVDGILCVKFTRNSQASSHNWEETDAKESADGMDEEVNFEFVSSLDSNESSQESSQKMPAFPEDMKLAGWLKLSGLGLLKTVKHVWFQYGDDTGKLYYYLQPQDRLPLGEIDLRNSSLSYDAWNKDRPGLFEVRFVRVILFFILPLDLLFYHRFSYLLCQYLFIIHLLQVSEPMFFSLPKITQSGYVNVKTHYSLIYNT